jgi:predicted nucleic acid-binding protein
VTALVDTNILVALADRRDRDHRRVVRLIDEIDDDLLVPVTVLPEADYLISIRVNAKVALGVIAGIADGDFRLEQVTAADLARCVELMRQYSDSDIGFVDASIVALAERLHVTRVLTLDRRHFGQIRPRHAPTLEILP